MTVPNPPIPVPRHTRDDCILALQQVGARHAPSAARLSTVRYDALRDPEQPSSSSVLRRFGSWDAALAAAGSPTGAGRFDEALELVRALSGEKPCRMTAYSRARPGHLPNVTTLVKHHGTGWKDVLAAAGVHAPSVEERVDTSLRKLHAKLGRPISTEDYFKARKRGSADPTLTTVYKVHGSWDAACSAAGVPSVNG